MTSPPTPRGGGSVAAVRIHASQFAEAIRRDLRNSLRTRRVNHKFHYDSVKQTNQWLALHEAHSPARYDQDCRRTYERAFAEITKRIKARRVHVIGLGCGGGQKDTRLLRRLKPARRLFYTPCDVSPAMTLVARKAALAVVDDSDCFPFVCDLATADSQLVEPLTAGPKKAARLITFFGMIPNFEPAKILPQLASWVRRGDTLLFSANLAPGPDYAAGVQKILPQYDNALTRAWLLTFLLDLGVERGDGQLRFEIETGAFGLRRVLAVFRFSRARKLYVQGEQFPFARGEAIRLFFSYRYTPQLVRQRLAKFGLAVEQEWITQSGEEGVFHCRRQ